MPSHPYSEEVHLTTMGSSSGLSRSRQKSCNACVRSKRRCDKRAPACGRCTKRRYLCVYGGLADIRHAFGDSAHDPIQLDSLPDPGSDTCGDAPIFNAADFTTPLDPNLALVTSPTLQLDSALESFLDALPVIDFEDDASWQTDAFKQQLQVPSASCEQALTLKDYQKMLNMCVCDWAPLRILAFGTHDRRRVFNHGKQRIQRPRSPIR